LPAEALQRFLVVLSQVRVEHLLLQRRGIAGVILEPEEQSQLLQDLKQQLNQRVTGRLEGVLEVEENQPGLDLLEAIIADIVTL
tara:strand:+ start:302 stop:553 length:252 start_codon:yes stop_codon:yes gene_type:complete